MSGSPPSGHGKKDLNSFFDMKNKLCYCTVVLVLFTFFGLQHNPSVVFFQTLLSEVLRMCFYTTGMNIPAFDLVDINKTLLPPLHIKLRLMTNIVKAMEKNGAIFQHLPTMFPRLSVDKLKEGIFVEYILIIFAKYNLKSTWNQETRCDKAKLFENLNSAHKN